MDYADFYSRLLKNLKFSYKVTFHKHLFYMVLISFKTLSQKIPNNGNNFYYYLPATYPIFQLNKTNKKSKTKFLHTFNKISRTIEWENQFRFLKKPSNLIKTNKISI